MNLAEANAVVSAVSSWAIKRGDIRAMALVGSWARGNQGQVSDIDLLLLSDRAHEYRHSQEWLTEIDFQGTGYRLNSSESANYGVAWSRHMHLLPAAEVELTFAECCWAQTAMGYCPSLLPQSCPVRAKLEHLYFTRLHYPGGPR
jgi:Nucleotidyltransferase domain